MSDIEFRVDKAFSSAVEQQLDEQREIRRLVSRVDESLIALSDGLVDLSGKVGGDGGPVATPDDLERLRGAIADDLSDLAARVESLDAKVGARPGDDELTSTLARTRADLLEALARLERDAAPVAEAVDESRREVTAALRRITEMVDANRDEAWVEAVDRLDGAISSMMEGQTRDREEARAVVEGLQRDAERALDDMRSRAEQALADALERAGSASASAVEQLSGASTAAVEKASRDTAAAVERTTSDATAAVEQVAEDIALHNREVVANLRQTTDTASGNAAEIAERVARMSDEVAARHDDIVDRLAMVVDASQATAPEVRAVLDDLAGQLGRLVEQQRNEAEQAIERIAAGRGATPEEVEAVVGGLGGRLDDAITTRFARVGEATDQATQALLSTTDQATQALLSTSDQATAAMMSTASDAADAMQATADQAAVALQDASTATLSDLRAAVERLSGTASDSASHLQSLTERLEARLEESTAQQTLVAEQAVERAVSSLLEVQTATTQEMRAATEVLTDAAGALEPAVGTALTELKAALLERAGADRDEVEAAIAALGEASAAARDGVLSAVGRATARLAEAQAEGIGRLTAVTDDLGRLPETISPPVLTAIEQMQTAVADAIGQLREATGEATRGARAGMEAATEHAQGVLDQRIATAGDDVVASWERLIAAQTDGAQNLEAATTALGQLAEGLEPGVRAALDDVRTTLLAEAAADRDRTQRALDGLTQASDGAATRVRDAVDEVAGSLRDAADSAAHRLVSSQAGGVEAMQDATQQLADATSQIPTVMSETRTGLLEALAEARAEIDQLLSRTDEVTDRRVAALFQQASEVMADQLAAHEASMATRTAEVVEAAGRITPTVDSLVQRLQDEVATVATSVLADLQAPIVEAGRVAEAMQPALARIVDEFREALTADAEVVASRSEEATNRLTLAAENLQATSASIAPSADEAFASLRAAVDEVAQRSAGATSMITAESRDLLLQAMEQVRQDLAGELDQTREAMREATEAHRTTQDRSAEQLQAAADAIGTVTGQLGPEVAAIVEDLRANLLAEAKAERTRADASINMLRESVATTIGSLQEELASTRIAASGAATELGEATERARTAIDDGLAGIRGQLAAAMQTHLQDLSDRLSSAGADTAQTSEALRDAAQQLAGGLDDAVQRTATAMQETLALVQQQVAEATEQSTTRSSKASEDLVTLGAEVVGTVQAAAGEVTRKLDDSQSTLAGSLAQMVELLDQVRAEVEDKLTGTAQNVERQTAVLDERIVQFQGIEGETVTRIDALVADVTARLTDELSRTREALRGSATEGQQAFSEAQTGFDAHITRLLGGVEERVASLGEVLERVTASQVSGDRGLEDGLDRVVAQVDELRSAVSAQVAALEQREGASTAGVAELAARIEPLHGLPDAVQGGLEQIRAEMAEVLAAASSGSLAAPTLFESEQSPIVALLSGMEKRMVQAIAGATADLQVTADPRAGEEALARVARAGEERVEAIVDRLDQILARLDRDAGSDDAGQTAQIAQTGEALAEMQRTARADTDALLDALASRTDELLNGVAHRTEDVLSNLTTAEAALRDSLTEAFQQIQMDGLGRLDEATSRLIALGPRLERQTSTRVDDVVTRVIDSISELSRAVQRVEHVDQRVDDAVRRAVDDARRTIEASVNAGAGDTDVVTSMLDALGEQMRTLMTRTEAIERSVPEAIKNAVPDAIQRATPAAGETQPAAPVPAPRPATPEQNREAAARRMAPTPSDVVTPRSLGGSTVCPDCGFVARTPPGLAAHRRTCTATS